MVALEIIASDVLKPIAAARTEGNPIKIQRAVVIRPEICKSKFWFSLQSFLFGFRQFFSWFCHCRTQPQLLAWASTLKNGLAPKGSPPPKEASELKILLWSAYLWQKNKLCKVWLQSNGYFQRNGRDKLAGVSLSSTHMHMVYRPSEARPFLYPAHFSGKKNQSDWNYY